MSQIVLSLDKCIETFEGTIEMQKDSIKRLRSKRSKDAAKHTLEVFEATVYHLRCLKKSKDDETHIINDITRV